MRTEVALEVLPRLRVGVGRGCRHDLHAHAAVAGGEKCPGHGHVVEGPGGHPDLAVARARGAQRGARAAPDALDRVEDPVADLDLGRVTTRGIAEVARPGDDVVARW